MREENLRENIYKWQISLISLSHFLSTFVGGGYVGDYGGASEVTRLIGRLLP
jgi:hypothetical protein